MPTTTVTVLYVNQPKPGKTYGSISTKELGYVSVKPDDLKLFQQGQRTEIETAIKNINGKDYHNFVRISPQQQAQPFLRAAAQMTEKDDQARHIFITGVVGRAMGSGQFAPTDISNLAFEAHEAWKRLMAFEDNDPTEVPEEEMPF